MIGESKMALKATSSNSQKEAKRSLEAKDESRQRSFNDSILGSIRATGDLKQRRSSIMEVCRNEERWMTELREEKEKIDETHQ